MRTFGLLAVAAALAAGIFGCSPARNPEAEGAAVAAAQEWLALVDGGRYDESWDAAAGFFRNAVTKEQWARSMRTYRQPLGALASRTLKAKRYRTALPGAPDGEYVVIQFRSSFEKKKDAVETITPMKEADGVWRVSGYFIR